MNESDHNLPRVAGAPQGIKRQLPRLPKKVANAGKADIRRDARKRGNRQRQNYKVTVRKRSALVMTRTELMLIAALAIIGLSRIPLKG